MTSDPNQIREQIEETRTSLSQDVNTLADTVNPAHAARRKAASAVTAVQGARRKIMGTASESASSTTSAVSGAASALGAKASSAPGQLRGQAAGNPLAAGVIAMGVGWLLGSLLPASAAEKDAAAAAEDKARPTLEGAAREAAASLQDSAQQAAQSVRDSAAGAAATVKDEAASSAHDVRNQAQAARGAVADTVR